MSPPKHSGNCMYHLVPHSVSRHFAHASAHCVTPSGVDTVLQQCKSQCTVSTVHCTMTLYLHIEIKLRLISPKSTTSLKLSFLCRSDGLDCVQPNELKLHGAAAYIGSTKHAPSNLQNMNLQCSIPVVPPAVASKQLKLDMHILFDRLEPHIH